MVNLRIQNFLKLRKRWLLPAEVGLIVLSLGINSGRTQDVGTRLLVYQLAKKAESLFQQGNYAEAEDICKKILEVNPQFHPAYNILGNICIKEKEREKEALSYFKKSISIYPRQASVYVVISLLYRKLNNLAEAISYLQQGLKYSPHNFQLNFNLGFLYLSQKHDPYKAIHFLQIAEKIDRVTKKNSDNDKLLYLLGISHMLTGNQFLALEYVTKLREAKNEYLATKLEALIREYGGQNTSFNMSEVMEIYHKEDKEEKLKSNEPSSSTKSHLTVDGPVRREIKGKGKLIIKTRIKKKDKGLPGIIP